MTVKVIDASALAALAFGEPEGLALRAELSGGRYLAPTLLPFELSSVAWKKIRREPEREAHWLACLRNALALPIRLVALPPDAVVQLALRTRLTTYDAAYLYLARRLSIPLITLDVRLRAAATGVH